MHGWPWQRQALNCTREQRGMQMPVLKHCCRVIWRTIRIQCAVIITAKDMTAETTAAEKTNTGVQEITKTGKSSWKRPELSGIISMEIFCFGGKVLLNRAIFCCVLQARLKKYRTDLQFLQVRIYQERVCQSHNWKASAASNITFLPSVPRSSGFFCATSLYYCQLYYVTYMINPLNNFLR